MSGVQSFIGNVNPSLVGWFAYFQHSSDANVFTDHDGGLRMRLRSLLRQRSGRRGRGRDSDHQTWTNRDFVEHGLFLLQTAHASAVQSSSR